MDLSLPDNKAIELARQLMIDFSERTGLTESDPKEQDRYLWTDAFAVLNYLALYSIFENDKYRELAHRLIRQVHRVLGRYHPEDERNGWISGLSEEQGKMHPTIKGLRIGKKQPERSSSERYDAEKEWDRDGQYFHYHTRWIHALLKAAVYLKEKAFIDHAAELSLAGRHFLNADSEPPHLYWKMSVDLSRPQVYSMGAHDPLDGYLTAVSCRQASDDEKYDFNDYLSTLESICDGKNWQTTDALGLGGLLLNASRADELHEYSSLSSSVQAGKLFRDAYTGLQIHASQKDMSSSAAYRLAFRECGLSLGLRVTESNGDRFMGSYPVVNKITDNISLADRIEDFWSDHHNRTYPSFRDHLNINEVSLSSSLLARSEPDYFM